MHKELYCLASNIIVVSGDLDKFGTQHSDEDSLERIF